MNSVPSRVAPALTPYALSMRITSPPLRSSSLVNTLLSLIPRILVTPTEIAREMSLSAALELKLLAVSQLIYFHSILLESIILSSCLLQNMNTKNESTGPHNPKMSAPSGKTETPGGTCPGGTSGKRWFG